MGSLNRVAVLAGLLVLALESQALAQITFVASYTNEGVNEGFNDPTLGAARRNAFETALNRIGRQFQNSHVGETVVVGAVFDPLGGSSNSAVLGFAGATSLYSGFANQPISGVYYPVALANHLSQSDLNSGTPEINITFNTDVDNSTVLGNSNWYYGTDANPGIHIDLISVAMHELGHGLGFSSRLQSNGSYLSNARSIYDYFMNTSSSNGTKLMDLGTDSARAAEAIGNDLWWDGANGTSGNSGTRPKLYAPNPFEPGSSLSHLDETVHENELMSPEFDEVRHYYSLIEVGMLRDMGWDAVPVPEPATGLALGFVTLALVGGVRRMLAKKVTA